MKRSCRRMDGSPKKGYVSLEDAQKFVNPEALQNAYECKVCGFFHVGHKPGTTMRQLVALRIVRKRGV